MSTITSARAVEPAHVDEEHVSWLRLLWVAPLTVVASVAVCFAIRAVLQAINPALARMPQLGPPMLTLAAEGAIAAVVVFALFVLFVPRAIFWFRIVAVIALLISFLPDIALALGGEPMRSAMRVAEPLTSVGFGLGGPGGPGAGGGRPPGPPPGAAAGGGPPPNFFAAMPIQQVLILMLLHTAVAVVSVGLLTTLTRARPSRPSPSE